MDKIFLIDTNQITYQNLIDYINGIKQDYTDFELFFLNTIKNLVSKTVFDVEDLIKNMYDSNKDVILYSSGTTENPKKIYQSFQNMVKNVKVSSNRYNDIWGLFYEPNKMAWYQVLFQALLNQNTLVNMFDYDFKEIVDRIQQYSVTHISATPTLYKMIVSDDVTFDSVQHITFGGEGSTKKFQTQIGKYFPNARMKNIYASTEAGSIFASNDDLFKIPKSDSHLIKVINNELWIHKSIIGKSNSINLDGEWYNTNDLVEFVDEYKFRIIGRTSNVVKIAGYNVNLEVVESKIEKMDFVKICKVYSKKNSILGNVLICEIVPNKNFIDKKKSTFLIKSKLKKHEVPTQIKYVDSIKINKNGKIKR